MLLSYLIAGLALGAIYSVVAASLVATYVSTGVLNFAFAATAYFIGRFYYFLNSEHGWASWQAGIVAIVIASPILGLVLWALLFRLLRLATQLTKIVATIGLSVALPAAASIIFGDVAIATSPGLAPHPVETFTIFGTTVTLDHVIVYIAVATILVGGTVLLRYTTAGLRVRAVVDSEAMTSLSGVNPSFVSAGVWIVTTFLAGLIGVLAAPLVGLDAGSYVLLIAAAFAAVIAAQLHSLPIAVLTGIAIGIAGSILQWRLPSNNPLSAEIIPSVPFAFILVFLLYHAIRHRHMAPPEGVGGPLDKAIRIKDTFVGAAAHAFADGRVRTQRSWLDHRKIGPVLAFALLAIFVSQLGPLWSDRVGLAAILGVTFLSFTLVTGQGGMIWVSQIAFAGIGAITTAQLATNEGWFVLTAVLAGGVVAGAVGLALGSLTIRLGDLYVALTTLSFGLLLEFLVFKRPDFYRQGLGVEVPRPSFAAGTEAFDYMVLVIFALVALIVANLSRSSMGLALAAARSSEGASRTIGLSIVKTKLFVAVSGAVVAGIGGGLLAMYEKQTLTQNYDIIAGLVWLAVVVTIGVRTPTAALVAGAALAFMPAIFASYLPTSVAAVPTVLWGLGAILVARDPGGILGLHARQLDGLFGRIGSRFRAAPPPAVSAAEGSPE